MTNDAQPGEPDATAILQTCYEALEQRNQRIEELQLSLDRKQEEQDMLAGNLRPMEEQLKQLRGRHRAAENFRERATDPDAESYCCCYGARRRHARRRRSDRHP